MLPFYAGRSCSELVTQSDIVAALIRYSSSASLRIPTPNLYANASKALPGVSLLVSVLTAHENLSLALLSGRIHLRGWKSCERLPMTREGCRVSSCKTPLTLPWNAGTVRHDGPTGCENCLLPWVTGCRVPRLPSHGGCPRRASKQCPMAVTKRASDSLS